MQFSYENMYSFNLEKLMSKFKTKIQILKRIQVQMKALKDPPDSSLHNRAWSPGHRKAFPAAGDDTRYTQST